MAVLKVGLATNVVLITVNYHRSPYLTTHTVFMICVIEYQ